jgi:hypothetical protein
VALVGVALAALLAPGADRAAVDTARAGSGLSSSPRARRLLAIARAYLPGDWRYPVTDQALPRAACEELATLLPVRAREQRTEYSCGAATLGILLSHHGVWLPDRRLERITRTTRQGVDPWQLVAAARGRGVGVRRSFGAAARDLLAALAAGAPVAIDFQATYTPEDNPADDWGHYSVVVASDDRDLLLVDPSDVNPAHLRRIPWRALEKVWWDTTIHGHMRFEGWMMTLQDSPPGLPGQTLSALDALPALPLFGVPPAR